VTVAKRARVIPRSPAIAAAPASSGVRSASAADSGLPAPAASISATWRVVERGGAFGLLLLVHGLLLLGCALARSGRPADAAR
jgi:hypothetical protein